MTLWTSTPMDQSDEAVLLTAYSVAKRRVLENGFGAELDWYANKSALDFGEQEFLRETAWVILCSGMKESVIRLVFSQIEKSFLSWSSASEISASIELCKRKAFETFGNARKIEAIGKVCEIVAAEGFEPIRTAIIAQPKSALRRFPFIGPVTFFHLAKNLGLQVAKPDRHVSRVAATLGFQTAQALCEVMSRYTGDPVPVVDSVFWRFCTFTPDYINILVALRTACVTERSEVSPAAEDVQVR